MHLVHKDFDLSILRDNSTSCAIRGGAPKNKDFCRVSLDYLKVACMLVGRRRRRRCSQYGNSMPT
jgi:hypothetical protein